MTMREVRSGAAHEHVLSPGVRKTQSLRRQGVRIIRFAGATDFAYPTRTSCGGKADGRIRFLCHSGSQTTDAGNDRQ